MLCIVTYTRENEKITDELNKIFMAFHAIYKDLLKVVVCCEKPLKVKNVPYCIEYFKVGGTKYRRLIQLMDRDDSEYYLSIDNQTEAVKYFDKVLVSRGLTGYADRQGATLTLEKVIQERRKELVCEGQYFFTQKRYNQNIYEPKSGKIYQASNDIYVLPLPENETEYRY